MRVAKLIKQLENENSEEKINPFESFSEENKFYNVRII